MTIALAVSVMPIFLFLGALVLLDSYKLIPLKAILLAVAAGAISGAVGYDVNVRLQPELALDLGAIRSSSHPWSRNCSRRCTSSG
jgi:hypothetical protein